MNHKTLSTLAMGLLVIGLLAWSPWITPKIAENAAITQFNQKWMNIIDGCGFNCDDCGAVGYRKVAFGIFVTLQYGCGLMYPDQPLEESTVFVSFLGIARNIPKP